MSELSQFSLNDPTSLKILKKKMKNQRETELRKEIKSEKLINLLMKEDYTAIQFLIFWYLDFLDATGIKTNRKKKVLLSIIFKTKGFENVRKYLSDFKQLKTKENLDILFDLFSELGLPEPLKKVEKDLNRPIKSKSV